MVLLEVKLEEAECASSAVAQRSIWQIIDEQLDQEGGALRQARTLLIEVEQRREGQGELRVDTQRAARIARYAAAAAACATRSREPR